jgi:hypothetical protein
MEMKILQRDRNYFIAVGCNVNAWAGPFSKDNSRSFNQLSAFYGTKGSHDSGTEP